MISSTSTDSLRMICQVCGVLAHGFNYGVMSCDACKMFFHRHVLSQSALHCNKKGECFNTLPPQKCPACRFQKCISSGMVSNSPKLMDIKCLPDDWKIQMVKRLVEDDAIREDNYLKKFSFEDPSFIDIVKRGSSMLWEPREEKYTMRIVDWCFINSLTGIHFLLNLGFMRRIDDGDKVRLLKSFYIKSSLMFWAYRMYLSNSESLQTPEGEEIYPDSIGFIPLFTPDKVNKMRKCPVANFRELEVTKQEMVLILVILFCNPGITDLSPYAVEIVAHQQQIHNSALFHYCQLKHGNQAPTRLTNLLSITHSMIKHETDVEMVCMMLRINEPDYKMQKLVCNEA